MTLPKPVVPILPERHASEALFDTDPVYDCDECQDKRWVRVEIPEKDRTPTMADHYYRECSRCLPERYRIMVEENHGEPAHRMAGGCRTCKPYVLAGRVGK